MKKILIAALFCICTAPAMAQFYDVQMTEEEAFNSTITANGSVTVPRGYKMPIREYQVDPVTGDVTWERRYQVDNRDPAYSCNGDACQGPTCGGQSGGSFCAISVLCPDGVTHYTVGGDCLFRMYCNPGGVITCDCWSCVCEIDFGDIPICPPGTPPGNGGPNALLEIQKCIDSEEDDSPWGGCASGWDDCPMCSY